MTEEKARTTLEKIESLIVGGQKEVLDKIARVETSLRGEIQEVRGEVQAVRGGLNKLDKKVDAVHSSLKKEIIATATAVKYDLDTRVTKLEAVSC